MGVVVDDHHAVPRCVDVQLEGIGAALERPRERRNRVLGELELGASVGDALNGSFRGSFHATVLVRSGILPAREHRSGAGWRPARRMCIGP
jgi:hypothetical protein